MDRYMELDESDYKWDDQLWNDESADMENRAGTPDELIEAAQVASLETLPVKSRKRYLKVFNDFQSWKLNKNATSNSQRVFMSYFSEMAEKYKPPTLWSKYSMLKATMKIKCDVDIGKYAQITGFIKTKAVGYKSVQAVSFKEHEIKRFLDSAPEELWLDVMVVCIFGVCGACRSYELPTVVLDDIEKHDKLYLVNIPLTKTNESRSFTIGQPYFSVVEKYANLRPATANHNRFFLNYQRGRCTVQTIGTNKFYKMAERVAAFLKLPEPHRYTGHSFRRTSASVVANAGASVDVLQKHGGWATAKTAQRYVDTSFAYKKRTGDIITSAINPEKDIRSSVHKIAHSFLTLQNT